MAPGSDGAPHTLSELMVGKIYMLVGFVQETSHFCVERARELSADLDLQKSLGNACAAMFVAPPGSLSAWQGDIGDGTALFVAGRSYEAKTKFSRIFEAFGAPLEGLPTFILIDANGQVVSNSFDVPADTIRAYCQ